MGSAEVFLSIIIPVYNKDKYLGDCIRSLKKQKFTDEVEIVFVNDGSTDKSFDIMHAYQECNGNVVIINQSNSGVASARNKGLEMSKGKYVTWVDPDDYISDDWWGILRPKLKTNPDMVYFDMYTLKNGVLRELSFDKKSRDISHEELCTELAVGNKIKSHLWSKIILRSFFNQSFSTKYSYCEDFALLHHVVFNVNKCQYIHKPLYIYRQLESSIVHDENKILDNLILGIFLYKKRYNFFRKKGMNVPRIGIYLAMLNYCYEYVRRVDKTQCKKRRIYAICIKVLRGNKRYIISSRYLSIKDKIKYIILLFGMIKIFIALKNK